MTCGDIPCGTVIDLSYTSEPISEPSTVTIMFLLTFVGRVNGCARSVWRGVGVIVGREVDGVRVKLERQYGVLRARPWAIAKRGLFLASLGGAKVTKNFPVKFYHYKTLR